MAYTPISFLSAGDPQGPESRMIGDLALSARRLRFSE